jgi:hypothetical protein
MKLNPNYKVLLSEVLPHLTMYQDDIKKYDRESLTGYEGAFISAYRTTGTHLFKLDSLADSARWTYKDINESINLTHETEIVCLNMNEKFLYVSADGSYKHISKEAVVKQLEAKKQIALDVAKQIEQINLFAMATELEFYREFNGRSWKAKLIEHWNTDYCSPSLRRARNLFGESMLKSMTKVVSQEKVYELLIDAYIAQQDSCMSEEIAA